MFYVDSLILREEYQPVVSSLGYFPGPKKGLK